MKACGNSDCCVSTGIHEGLTFGRGELDDLGYWEIPCGICAREWEEKYLPTEEVLTRYGTRKVPRAF